MFGDLIYMQNAPKRQSQLLVISYCFSKSESIFYADSGCKYVHKSGPQSLDQKTAGINKPNWNGKEKLGETGELQDFLWEWHLLL